MQLSGFYDSINRLIQLTVIQLSGGHCILTHNLVQNDKFFFYFHG